MTATSRSDRSRSVRRPMLPVIVSDTFPKKICVTLLCVVFLLLLINILGIVSEFYFNHGSVYGLIPLFDFKGEGNIPALYSSFALIFSSLLLFLISYIHRKAKSPYFYWVILSIIFLFLSIDESVLIHERLTTPIKQYFNTSGIFYFAWIIPYGIALVIFLVAYSKFLLNLPKKTMILFIVSGTTFVMGAIGLESLGGIHVDLYGKKNITYSIFYTLEELLEMLGIVIFIYALLSYITSEFKVRTISIEANDGLG